jgi:hypothetical protein
MTEAYGLIVAPLELRILGILESVLQVQPPHGNSRSTLNAVVEAVGRVDDLCPHKEEEGSDSKVDKLRVEDFLWSLLDYTSTRHADNTLWPS